MADDFSALELDTELDEDMRALFGDTQEPTGPLAPSSSLAKTHMQQQNSVQVRLSSHSHRQGKNLACITNKRAASELNSAWPHKLKHPSLPASAAYDDLELEAQVPTFVSPASAVTGTRTPSLSNTGAESRHCTTSSKAMPRSSHKEPNAGSQVTEQWGSVTTSQANSQTRSAPQPWSRSWQSHALLPQAAQEPTASAATDIGLAMVSVSVQTACSCMPHHRSWQCQCDIARG